MTHVLKVSCLLPFLLAFLLLFLLPSRRAAAKQAWIQKPLVFVLILRYCVRLRLADICATRSL